MKIRLGYVANSSSATYTVTVLRTSLDDLRTVIADIGFSFFSNNLLQKGIDSALEGVRRIGILLSELDEIKEKQLLDLKDQATVAEDTLEQLRIYCELKQISVSEESGNVAFTAHTPMHNDYYGGLPLFLQELILYLRFEQPGIDVICRRKGDD